MEKTRLEAFSDGVLAIIITIMVLELKAPHEATIEALFNLAPVFVSYVMSFLFIGIYWGNHHHLLHTVKKSNSYIMLANLNLLFWLSLVPFANAWMGENHFAAIPTAAYAGLLLVCGFAYDILRRVIENSLQHEHQLKHALKKQSTKGYISLFSYFSAIPLAFFNPYISVAIFCFVAVMWIIPDKNIEKSFGNH